ncbi:MAG: hypothetical protein ACUVWN_05185 [bacterium]
MKPAKLDELEDKADNTMCKLAFIPDGDRKDWNIQLYKTKQNIYEKRGTFLSR